MESKKRIIVNADDFGYRKDINKGIIYAHKNGIVTNTSVLTERDAFEDAVSLAKENPGLKNGLHIDLDTFVDINRDVIGVASVSSFQVTKPDKQKILNSMNMQIDKFLNSGLKLSHLDGHHHAHMHPEIFPLVAQKAKELNVPVRFFEWFYDDFNLAQQMKQILLDLNVKFCPHFINGWYWGNVDEDFQLAELMTHPGFNEMWREFETAKCCDPVLKTYLNEKHIELISFEDI